MERKYLLAALIGALVGSAHAATAQSVAAGPDGPPPQSAPTEQTVAQPGPATDQPTPGDVVVTGSRIVANGFQQPTPVTVVGSQDIARQAPVTIGSYLNTLPSFGATTSATNPGIGVSGGGTEFVNLRNLGVTRTLVLLDNRRTVEAGTSGGVDTVTLPNGLIKRVEVVTGGASAAWGSDAVAGVVNFVLNRDYRGLGINIESGVTQRWDNPYAKLNVTAGTDFLGGRGHVIAEFDYSNAPEGVDIRDRRWFDGRAVVANPAYVAGNGQPRQITITGAAPSNISPGGVITSGPLRGIQFVGPNGTPVPYNFGTQSGSVQYGGDTDNSVGLSRGITSALNYANLFVHADYEVAAHVKAYVEGSYDASSYYDNGYLYFYRQGNLPISIDNAYLDPGIRQQMVNRGITSFNLGLDTVDAGPPTSTNRREVWRATVGFDGEIGSSWRWHAYYTHGDAQAHIRTYNDTVVANFLLAADAVRSPTTGAIVCRSTLTNLSNGCSPLDVFGNGVESQAANAYIHATAIQDSDVQLDVVSADASGTLFRLPAGDVSFAFGADYINNRASSTQNDLALNRQFAVNNFQPFTGERNVKEGFVEAEVPVLHDVPLAQKLAINAAARLTSYSTSGRVTTWKFGLSDEVADGLRVRATLSRDIRAPTLLELFSGGTVTQQSVFDPLTQKTYPQYTVAAGNPALKPEDANTFTAGVVFSPRFIPGLSLSVDYFRIKIDGAIASISAPLELQYCVSGQIQYCPYITRDAGGAITSILTLPVNIASQQTSGWDFEADYRRRLGAGTISVRALASYVPDYTQIDASGNRTQLAGQIGDLNPGEPKFRAHATATYEQGPAAFTLFSTFIGGAKLQNAWVTGVDVDNNSVPSYITFGITASYRFALRSAPIELTAGIDNLFDRDPVDVPVIPGTVQYGTAPGTGGRFDLYDVLGRRFRVGARVKF